jgi:streptogramin lyase
MVSWTYPTNPLDGLEGRRSAGNIRFCQALFSVKPFNSTGKLSLSFEGRNRYSRRGVSLVSYSFRSSLALRLALPLALLAIVSPGLSAQTAPQLLPYTAKVIAGGGSTAATVGAACQRTGATPSGNVSYDIYGDGCLATEIQLTAPRYAITDSTGAVYFSDYTNGLVRRVDPTTGIVTAIVGGAATQPASGANCGTKDPAHTVVTGDVFADGCLGTSVKLGKPTSLVFSPSGDLYFSDTYNYDVRKMSLHSGGVAAVIINSGGSGYTTAPTVTFSAPPTGGTTATGTATISGGVVTGVTITNSGAGYTTAPAVTFSVSGSGTAATGTSVYTGVMSMAAGSNNGTSTSAHGYSAGCSVALTATATSNPTWCVLDAPYGLAFDAAGNLYISEEYYEAILVLNTNTAGSTTVATVPIPAQTIVKVVGTRASGAACLTGTGTTTTGNSGCNYGTYTIATAATLSELDAPYGVTLDSSNNIYIADEYENTVAQVNASTGILNNYAGLYPQSGNSIIEPATKRGPAGFQIGTDFGLDTDNANNLYVTDALAGYVWRIDATTQTMYVVGGGATAVCTSPIASPTDTFGDGCPARQATFSKSGTLYASTGVFGVYADTSGNVFLGDQGNNLVREISSGTQFGSTGATATDYVDIHFAAGDTPITASGTTVPFAITSGSSIFTLGTPVCTTNTDNSGAANTEDCVIPVTATPTVSGPFTGTLTVKSTLVTAGTSFPLSGNFVQSPVTRLALTSAGTATCSGTTYSTTTPVTLTASLTANGPSAPTGTITFYTGPAGTLTQIGTPQAVTNIGTMTAPIYGANLTYTFSTAGTYNITATYTPTAGSYFQPSTNSASVTSQVAAFSMSPVSYQQATVSPGQTALYSFNLTQTVYTGTITFACSGLPANSSCVFSPPSITGAGCSTSSTIALSILTQQQTTVQPGSFAAGRGRWQLLAAFTGVLLALMIGLRRRSTALARISMALALLLAASGAIACGKPVGSVLQAGTPPSPAGQPYSITVTATGSVGATPAPVVFQLTVL